jgi:hypothetical protein
MLNLWHAGQTSVPLHRSPRHIWCNDLGSKWCWSKHIELFVGTSTFGSSPALSSRVRLN